MIFKPTIKYLSKLFLNGVLVLIPLVITLFIIYWLISGFESIFRSIIFLFSKEIYFPGMGTLLAIITIFLVGLLMQSWGMVRLYKYGEQLIAKFPLMGDIYSSLKSLLQYFTSPSNQSVEQVVIVEYANVKALGIVTRVDFAGAPEGIGGPNIIAVYLPMSYQIGGYTIYLDKKYVTPINMSKKEALQWILTAGLTSKKAGEVKPVKVTTTEPIPLS